MIRLIALFVFSAALPPHYSGASHISWKITPDTGTYQVHHKKKATTVLLDCFFNNEWKTDSAGKKSRYHYTWNDTKNTGFSLLGEIFNKHGARTKYLEAAPTIARLKEADIYFIVDPDTKKETIHPNYMNDKNATVIAEWVHSGGVLVLMGNDSGNAELEKFNILASKFGIHFNKDNFNQVKGKQYEQGAIMVPSGHPVFKSAGKIYIKELATLQVSDPARVILTKEGKNIMAVARYGKGTVFAVGDPWLYNEYIDHRNLSSDFENYKAAEDLVNWLISLPDAK